MGELAVRPVDLSPGLEQGHDRGPFGLQQPVQRMPAWGPVGELPGLTPGLPPAQPNVIETEQARRPPRRPAALDSMIDQVKQAGLDTLFHAWRDQAGAQSQRAFPSCRCIATACSVTVARSRSISSLAAAIAACSPDWPGRPGTEAANASNAPCLATRQT